MIDCSGSGNVDMTTTVTAEGGFLTVGQQPSYSDSFQGLSGRKIKLAALDSRIINKLDNNSSLACNF